MIMAWDNYGYTPEPPPPKRMVFACRNETIAAKLRAEMALARFTCVAPDLDTYEKDFDVLVMCFDPTTNKEQTWFHDVAKNLIHVNGDIYWACG